MKRLHDFWLAFEGTVIPPGASEAMKATIRCTFYAGALATMMAVKKIGDDEKAADEEGARRLAALEQEALQGLKTNAAMVS